MHTAHQDFPDEVQSGFKRPVCRYLRVDNAFSMSGKPPPSFATIVTLSSKGRNVVVCRGALSEALESCPHSELGPVYALDGKGPPAVPTGWVFVRFDKQVSLASREEDLAKAGYVVVERIPHAPNAGWVTASSGQLADSLKQLSRLRSVPDLLNAEPQMLMERVKRGLTRRG